MTDRYVLARDVTMLPVEALDDTFRQRLGAQPGDYCLDRPLGRTTARLIDADTVLLLRTFRKPRSLAEAIVRAAERRNVDPASIVRPAWEVLSRLIEDRFLHLESERPADPSPAELAPGASLGAFRIQECVRTMEDVDVYSATGPERAQLVAIKRWRSDTGATRRTAAHEAAVLARAAPIAPALIATGAEGYPWIAMEWRSGSSVTDAGEMIRRGSTLDLQQQLGQLVISIADAYADLHRSGILHGDVNSGNCLVGRDGTVTILDFGYGLMAGAQEKPPRAGVLTCMEPELAAVMGDENTPSPSATAAGEQYSVAALIYNVVTGEEYLDFQPARERAIAQIVNDPPRSFSAAGARPWPEVEGVLNRALSKDPLQRFPDTGEFARALRKAVRITSDNSIRVTAGPDPARRFSSLWRRIQINSARGRGGLRVAPTASIAYGATGIAAAWYRRALVHQSAEHLATARHWINVAADERESATAFHDGKELTPSMIGAVSIHHGEAGLWLTGALIAHAAGDEAGATQAVGSWTRAARSRNRNLDLTLGRAGVLLGGSTLIDALHKPWPRLAAAVARRAASVRDDLLLSMKDYPTVGSGELLPNLGIAHGWGGVLYAFLRLRRSGHASPTGDSFLERRLHELARCASPSGRGLRWPWRDAPVAAGHREAFIGGWCNGSAGLAHLWLEARAAFDDPSFMELASGAAWNAWEYDGDEIGSLCCGLAGRAYALLAMYRATGDFEWYRRGRILALRAGETVSLDGPESLSLFRGATGVALLIEEVDRADLARMPAFESEDWDR
ncbi:MAG: lanthionine synthetase LanC family protein [Gemmatimonadota bacterium]